MTLMRFSGDFNELIPRPGELVSSTGLNLSALALAVSRQIAQLPGPLVVLTPTALEAEDFLGDLAYFWPEGQATGRLLNLPAPTVKPFSGQPESREILAERLWALYSLATGRGPLVAAVSAQAALKLDLPVRTLTRKVEYLATGAEIDFAGLRDFLISCGYRATGLVESPGDFSARGGLLDLFPPGAAHPVRVEFFGDFVESIRYFDASTQRSVQDLEELTILPALSIIYESGSAERAADRLTALAGENSWHHLLWGPLADKLRSGQFFSDLDGYAPLFHDSLEPFTAFLTPRSRLIVYEPDSFSRETAAKSQSLGVHFDRLAQEERPHLPLERLYLSPTALLESLRAAPGGLWRSSRAQLFAKEDVPSNRYFQIPLEENADLRASKITRSGSGLLGPPAAKLKALLGRGLLVTVVLRTKEQSRRLAELLVEYDLSPSGKKPVSGGGLKFDLGQLEAGFVLPDLGLAFITEEEIFGGRRRLRRKAASELKSLSLSSLRDLNPGDYVVHSEHGIGQYLGLVTLTTHGRTGDFIHLAYKGGDKLYVPVERFGAVGKYVGAAERAPVLDKLGGHTWEKLKGRVKENIREMAEELLKLYAARELAVGPAFSPRDNLFKEFEASFEFDETPDQMAAIDQVLKDLSRPQPMDRLICGDVGYGKTEVAMRAAFKVVSDHRQVAVLAPTTVLAEQHAHTFAARLAAWPIVVESLSRFKKPSEQKEILARLKAGEIDVLIGTHRVLQKDVQFKDLGLLVIDEEHRFGVSAKEKLKKARTEVDILSLSATPIPRTLSMALNGIRDLSLIATPPQDRLAVKTRLLKYDDEVICEAIDRELSRGGQVFLVHNRIGDLGRLADVLRRFLPLVRFEIGHGRLKSEELEEIMIRFARREVDVLISTTIVESGLDFPNANSIIINQADKFGLAQLYQLRGRVGRGQVQAYAYLLVDDPDTLTDEARKRLKALLDNTDLGSGYQIAMHDLQIRGGGNILGAAQSGQASLVGYELYVQLMEEAIRELKGEPASEEINPELIIGWPAYLPLDYAPDTQSRLVLYRRASEAGTAQQLAALEDELRDRFGPLPPEARNLLAMMDLKLALKQAGVKRLEAGQSGLTLTFGPQGPPDGEKLINLVTARQSGLRLSPEGRLFVKTIDLKSAEDSTSLKNLLLELA